MVDQTIKAIKATSKTAEKLLDLRDDGLITEVSNSLNKEIASTLALVLALQQEQAELITKNSELDKKVSGFDNWEEEKQRYEMKKLEPGILVYTLKSDAANGQPDHNICADCYNKGRKSILHRTSHHRGLSWWKCNDCGFDETSGINNEQDQLSVDPDYY